MKPALSTKKVVRSYKLSLHLEGVHGFERDAFEMGVTEYVDGTFSFSPLFYMDGGWRSEQDEEKATSNYIKRHKYRAAVTRLLRKFMGEKEFTEIAKLTQEASIYKATGYSHE